MNNINDIIKNKFLFFINDFKSSYQLFNNVTKYKFSCFDIVIINNSYEYSVELYIYYHKINYCVNLIKLINKRFNTNFLEYFQYNCVSDLDFYLNDVARFIKKNFSMINDIDYDIIVKTFENSVLQFFDTTKLNKARQYFREKNYKKAYDLFCCLKNQLSNSDEKKLEFCKKHIGTDVQLE